MPTETKYQIRTNQGLRTKKGGKKRKNDKTFTQYYKKKNTIVELNIRWELGDNRNRWI